MAATCVRYVQRIYFMIQRYYINNGIRSNFIKKNRLIVKVKIYRRGWGSDVVSPYLMFASDQHRADETAAWLPRRQRSSRHRLPAGAVDDDVEEVCGDDDDVEDDDTVAKDDGEDDGGHDDNDNYKY